MYQQNELKASRQHTALVADVVEVTKHLPQVKCKLVHLFSQGFYGRALHIPAGTLVTGKKHKHSHYMALVSGSAQVLEDGLEKTLVGPVSTLSKAGAERLVLTHTDCVFFTLHKTNKTTLAEIEAEVIDTSKEELCLGE